MSHVVGGLDDSEGRVFRAHLLECNECRAQVGELRAIAHDLADVERNERRVRAAKTIETKRRETDEGELGEDEFPPSSRASRAALVVGLMLAIVLAAWNFTLRGNLMQLAEINARNVQASSVIEFGEPWDVDVHDSQVRGMVKRLGKELVVVVSNAETNRIYGVYVYNERGGLLWSEQVPAQKEGRLLVKPSADMSVAARVVVDDPGVGAESGPGPQGPILLEAQPSTAQV